MVATLPTGDPYDSRSWELVRGRFQRAQSFRWSSARVPWIVSRATGGRCSQATLPAIGIVDAGRLRRRKYRRGTGARAVRLAVPARLQQATGERLDCECKVRKEACSYLLAFEYSGSFADEGRVRLLQIRDDAATTSAACRGDKPGHAGKLSDPDEDGLQIDGGDAAGDRMTSVDGAGRCSKPAASRRECSPCTGFRRRTCMPERSSNSEPDDGQPSTYRFGSKAMRS